MLLLGDRGRTLVVEYDMRFVNSFLFGFSAASQPLRNLLLKRLTPFFPFSLNLLLLLLEFTSLLFSLLLHLLLELLLFALDQQLMLVRSID